MISVSSPSFLHRNLKWCAIANVHIFIEVIPLYNCNYYVTGLAFWKAPKRKFFAVPQQNITKSSSEVDLEEPTLKKPKLFGTEVKLNEIIKSIDNLRDDVSKILQVNKEMGVPVGLCNALTEVLKCKICHAIPMMPPILYAKCCKSIIGCERCVNS